MEAVDSLYINIKGDSFKSPLLDEESVKYSKEATIKKLCEILNVSYIQALEIDITFARRQLYADHVSKAYELGRHQYNAMKNKR